VKQSQWYLMMNKTGLQDADLGLDLFVDLGAE
jgi:hypothetical protein